MADYPPEQMEYQVDNAMVQFNLAEGDEDEDGTIIYTWMFDDFTVALSVFSDDRTALVYWDDTER